MPASEASKMTRSTVDFPAWIYLAAPDEANVWPFFNQMMLGEGLPTASQVMLNVSPMSRVYCAGATFVSLVKWGGIKFLSLWSRGSEKIKIGSICYFINHIGHIRLVSL